MSNSYHPLKPDETIHKALISTTSRLLGAYESDSILIGHAWPSLSNRLGFARYDENPASRSAYLVAFQTEPLEKGPGVALPNYSPIVELVCSYLSVLFGKRFDHHGLIESNGIYQIPDLSMYTSLSNPRLPFNSHRERKSFGVPLNLVHFSAVSSIVSGTDVDQKLLDRLNTACKFYMRALQTAETDPESSYIQLIMAWEIMSHHFGYNREELLDRQTLKDLAKIEDDLDGGKGIARRLRHRMSSIKRTFVKSIYGLVDDEFFVTKETDFGNGFFKKEDFCKRIGAAYDLRSRYVHSGGSFGRWIAPDIHSLDTQTGRPVEEDREYASILEKAPTLLGLERLIRYCLLRFMDGNGFPGIGRIANDGEVNVEKGQIE